MLLETYAHDGKIRGELIALALEINSNEKNDTIAILDKDQKVLTRIKFTDLAEAVACLTVIVTEE